MTDLVRVVRNGFVESVHRGSLVLLAPGGRDVTVGDVDEPVFPRSSLKPLQAVAHGRGRLRRPRRLARAGLRLARRRGDARRRGPGDAGRGGADEQALRCPPDLPGSRAALLDWVAGGGMPAAICHNCSGKHSAMVATCVAAGWPVESYVDPAHPLQQAIRARIESLAGPVSGVAVDGCGAPAFAVSLRGLAQAFAALATADRRRTGAGGRRDARPPAADRRHRAGGVAS